MAILRRYITLPDGQQLHLHEAGSGSAVVLLHASPLNAGFLAPQITALAAGHHAMALDTPGYGQSDPLPVPAQSIDDYARRMLEALSADGHQTFAVYGTATGAQIGLAMARLAPARITRLVLDNCCHFPPDVRAVWEADYFPDLTPQPDGSHWRRAWEIAEAQFRHFPWHIQTPETAVPAPPPPAAFTTAMAMGFMAARPAYDAAYRCAFRQEDATSFDGLSVPTVLLDWEGSLVRPYIHALIDAGLPDCVDVRVAGPRLEDRLAAIVAAVSA